jgi:hypothetical protein
MMNLLRIVHPKNYDSNSFYLIDEAHPAMPLLGGGLWNTKMAMPSPNNL